MSAIDNMDKNEPLGVLTQKLAKHSNVIFAAGLVVVLATLLIPLPTFVLDIGITISISISISVLIIVLSTSQPVDMSTFPSLLLSVTLFRLALNVASTRLILTQGDAGNIIYTFGNFVAGGNLIVGLVMFIILVVIQIVVITKGSQRIGEVSARFVLDAMPGKQMAIDADLNAGNITDEDAKKRREEIVKESEFYGAMDGAGKFIAGDVKAGMIITAVNLIGGIILGYVRGMTIPEAVRHFSILSIGDGLVCQIPSIVTAVSAGFLVSKIRSDNTVSHDLTKQLLKRWEPVAIAATVIGLFSLVPGFPKSPFLVISAGLGYFAYANRKAERTAKPKKTEQDGEKQADESTPVEELLNADILSIMVGVRLISMVDPRKESSVFERIGALRRKFAQQMGFIIPLVRLRDDINLEPNAYEIRFYDHVISSGTIEPDRYLAMDSGSVSKKVQGIATTEPVYGLPAMWITETQKEQAELSGYTVIDPESVLITHLSETLARNAHELLTREDVQQLVDRLRQTQPSLVGEVVGELVPVGLLQRVLQNLLREGISIRDMPLILESISEGAAKTKSPALLTELARKGLSRAITAQNQDMTGTINAITFDPALEHYLLNSINQQSDSITLNVVPEIAFEINNEIANAWKGAMEKPLDGVAVLCDARIRPSIRNLIERNLDKLAVLAYDEIVRGTNVENIYTVTLKENAAALSGQNVETV
jgi:flagellar biosynthesis protein FlhA